jgi:hypothetical protein
MQLYPPIFLFANLTKLDVTFASLGGNPVGCVNFLGIALVSTPNSKDHTPSMQPRLFLVFERATQGSIDTFLQSYLRDVDFITSWDRTISALSSIGTGLVSLHQHQVLHR